jgi:hypothetical protein
MSYSEEQLREMLRARYAVEKRILLKAYEDPSFREQLLVDAKQAIASFEENRIPEEIEYIAFLEQPNSLEIVLPATPQPVVTSEELSDETLEQVAGGGTHIVTDKDGWIIYTTRKGPDEGPWLVSQYPNPSPGPKLPPVPTEPDCPDPSDEGGDGTEFRR